MKKVLVTGAAGFIGSHVVRELLEENVEIRAAIKPGESTAGIDELDIETIQMDVLDKGAVDNAMKGVDTLFHLAAIYQLWLPERRAMYDVNMQGSRNVLWSALKHGLEKVVYTSSIAGVGVAPGKELSDETTPFDHWDAPDYVRTKHLSQQEALGFADNGLPLTIVNPAFPFGARDSAPTPTGKLIIEFLNGNMPVVLDIGLCAIDVIDIAKGHVLAAKKGKVGQMYLLANENLTMKEFYQRVAAVAGMKAPSLTLPSSIATPAAFLMEKFAKAGVEPLVTVSSAKYGAGFLFYDNSKAKKDLGLEFTPLEESLERSINWFRENGYIKK